MSVTDNISPSTQIPAKPSCLGQLKYSFLKGMFRTVGKLSKGIQIGWQYGFDSGESLDYVYENQADGIGPLGKLLDRFYLNSAGWKGIRKRGTNIKETIRWAINSSLESKENAPAAVELVDIASGPGRYVIDVLAYSQLKGLVQAHLFDVDRNGLAFGKKRAENLGIDKIEFQYRDAFAEETDPNIKGRADVAIASGLYELFSDNAMVSRSLSILAERVRDNGFLIYTNQPWHPQLEFIAEVLTNRHGQPWVMRCRSQEEMDELVRNAGFEKLSMKSDDAGIFTVSVARKIRNCGDGHSFRKMETTVAA
jgi:hypothetical protein